MLLSTGETVKARGEIVLTAGAIATPKLLQLSGIAQLNTLRRMACRCLSTCQGSAKTIRTISKPPFRSR